MREINTKFRDLTEWINRGQEVAYDDMRFPVNVSKAVVGREPSYNVEGLLEFSPTTLQSVMYLVQIPHTWKEGTPISPHIHWMKKSAAAGDVKWRLEYKWATLGDVVPVPWSFPATDIFTTVPGTPDTGAARVHMISSFGDEVLDTSDKQISDCILFLISRAASDAEDTYADDAIMFEFDIHYQIDSRGSRQLFIKDL